MSATRDGVSNRYVIISRSATVEAEKLCRICVCIDVDGIVDHTSCRTRHHHCPGRRQYSETIHSSRFTMHLVIKTACSCDRINRDTIGIDLSYNRLHIPCITGIVHTIMVIVFKEFYGQCAAVQIFIRERNRVVGSACVV